MMYILSSSQSAASSFLINTWLSHITIIIIIPNTITLFLILVFPGVGIRIATAIFTSSERSSFTWPSAASQATKRSWHKYWIDLDSMYVYI